MRFTVPRARHAPIFAAIAAALALSGCDFGTSTYTLYRASVLDATMRIHMATFDASNQGASYNQENCQIVADLMAKHPGVTVRYWCEKGTYRK